jgi:hypothetical protein
VNATVTQDQSTASHCQLTSPKESDCSQMCSKSPLTGWQVTSRPCNWFLRYSKWLDTFPKPLYTHFLKMRTDFIHDWYKLSVIEANHNTYSYKKKSTQNYILSFVSPSHSLPNMIMVIRSRQQRRAEQVACMGQKRNTYWVLVWRPEGRRPQEDLRLDGRIFWILS